MYSRHSLVRHACAFAAVVACGAAGAANISPAVYDAAREQLRATYKAQRDACDRLSGNAKDICVETAKGKEKVALAHLDYQRSGDANDMSRLADVRLDAQYEVAKEICDDQAGDSKNICLATAKADREKARAQAKMNMDVREARNDAAAAKDKADFKLASERCEAMSGNAKDVCVASARARYNQ